jgi:putative ABC transport system ATP-binding protein
VALARAIANDPDIILADEPTASLESNQGKEIIELLNYYAAVKNKCVVTATHDLRLKEFTDRIVYIENGCIVN